ncbi:MAG: hypothetical protein Kow0062_15630 [Acidobacteriota bacterium]
MTERAALRLERVTRRFGPVTALAEIDLAVARGEAVLLLGHNGAGKSTLLRLAAGLVRPTSGTVSVGGATGRDVPAAARGSIGYLGHRSFLHEHLTARENLEFYARLYGLRDAAARAELWLRRVGLARAAERVIRGFSRGMMQRLALARALIHDPEILLLDEPASGLDPEGRRGLVEIVRGAREGGATLLLVSHDPGLGLEIADRVVVLRRGRLAADEPAGRRSREQWAAAAGGRPG